MSPRPGRRRIARILVLVLAGGALHCGDGGTGVDGGDGTPPVITARVPVAGATAVSIRTAISVTLSESVSNTGSGPALRLECGGVLVPGQVTVSGRTVTLIPDQLLDLGTAYTATVGALTDPAGQSIDGERSWSFTTVGSAPPELSETRLREYLSRLADDSMAGRGSASADELRAAVYLRQEFMADGLQPALPDYFQSFTIGGGEVQSRPGGTSQNVLAVLPGQGDLANQWIIVGAHYDHLGTIEVTADSVVIYNGADDNASGTAVVLELAHVLSQYVASGGMGAEPRRSIMFQAYGAEELGLVGSEYYCEHPVAPMLNAAMINFDMVGWLRNNELSVAGLWTSQEWADVLARQNRDDLRLLDYRTCQSCTDYACFRRSGHPTLWFFTGFEPVYHTPGDDVEWIDFQGLHRVGQLALRTIIELALRRQPLPFYRVLP